MGKVVVGGRQKSSHTSPVGRKNASVSFSSHAAIGEAGI